MEKFIHEYPKSTMQSTWYFFRVTGWLMGTLTFDEQYGGLILDAQFFSLA
jgi:hypothetical protein